MLKRPPGAETSFSSPAHVQADLKTPVGAALGKNIDKLSIVLVKYVELYTKMYNKYVVKL
jgi:hypothetical protein